MILTQTTEFDAFSRTLLEEAKRFFERADESETEEATLANIHAALVLGIAAFEAHLSAIAAEFQDREELSVLEKSLLWEREIQISEGIFELTNKPKFYRAEDRYEYMYRRFGGAPVDKSCNWWAGLKTGIKLRNKLLHSKESPNVTLADVERALEAVISALDSLYRSIYKRRFPAAKLGCKSRLTF